MIEEGIFKAWNWFYKYQVKWSINIVIIQDVPVQVMRILIYEAFRVILLPLAFEAFLPINRNQFEFPSPPEPHAVISAHVGSVYCIKFSSQGALVLLIYSNRNNLRPFLISTCLVNWHYLHCSHCFPLSLSCVYYWYTFTCFYSQVRVYYCLVIVILIYNFLSISEQCMRHYARCFAHINLLILTPPRR